jgi:outer membrane protein OmpA-like peptidoglycan-associated protein
VNEVKISRTHALSGPFTAVWILAAALASAQPPATARDIPISSGTNIVLAVANATGSSGAPAGILQGDYEMVVSLSNVSADAITHVAAFDGVDANGVQRTGTVTRIVSAADLSRAPVQILGFHMDDPSRVTGATALGPSMAVTRGLVQNGSAAYSFRVWVNQAIVSGTLRRSQDSTVKFHVLLNGRRVVLDAIHATGEMSAGTAKRPFETLILDHPQYPISLRIAYGPRDGVFPFKPEFARDVVRIDTPAAAPLAETLNRECRAELKGIYFDFNQATIKPQSEPALQEIANALRASDRRFSIEGHTDNIGTDRYNDDLSARRAAAVKAALVRDHGIAEARLSTIGYGERRPVETNDTLAGRARNRRVELACADRH